jgi:hypothetical protein
MGDPRRRHGYENPTGLVGNPTERDEIAGKMSLDDDHLWHAL